MKTIIFIFLSLIFQSQASFRSEADLQEALRQGEAARANSPCVWVIAVGKGGGKLSSVNGTMLTPQHAITCAHFKDIIGTVENIYVFSFAKGFTVAYTVNENADTIIDLAKTIEQNQSNGSVKKATPHFPSQLCNKYSQSITDEIELLRSADCMPLLKYLAQTPGSIESVNCEENPDLCILSLDKPFDGVPLARINELAFNNEELRYTIFGFSPHTCVVGASGKPVTAKNMLL